jgi:hypothetical protein
VTHLRRKKASEQEIHPFPDSAINSRENTDNSNKVVKNRLFWKKNKDFYSVIHYNRPEWIDPSILGKVSRLQLRYLLSVFRETNIFRHGACNSDAGSIASYTGYAEAETGSASRLTDKVSDCLGVKSDPSTGKSSRLKGG